MNNILIIGNGIAGITAARNIRKMDSSAHITVISAESPHFYSRPALMYIYMGHLTLEQTKPYEDWFWQKNRINLLQDYVTTIDTEAQKLHTQSGNVLQYDKLILATGSQSNRFGWKGEDLGGVQGLYSLQDLQLMENNTRGIRSAVVVGGGLIGIEVAEMLHSRHIHVTMLVREPSYWSNVLPAEESAMISRHIREHGIDLLLGEELDEILSNEHGYASAVRTKSGKRIECQFVALTAGVRPNTSMVKNTAIACARGILVNEYFETNIPNIYAIGDCAEIQPDDGSRSYIQPLWYAGELHGETVARTLCGTRTRYNKGIYFNSAKFLDIEYQVYGNIPSASAPQSNDIHTLYWEHADGKRAIRIQYNSTQVLGFNCMGVRYRHKQCEEWLASGAQIEYVLTHLAQANFDPEFFLRFEKEIVAMYNARHGTQLRLGAARSIFGYKRFLDKVPASV